MAHTFDDQIVFKDLEFSTEQLINANVQLHILKTLRNKLAMVTNICK